MSLASDHVAAASSASSAGDAARGPFRLEDVAECNLCGGRDHALYAERRGQLTGILFRIVRCRDCGLAFVTPRLVDEVNRALYDESYFNGRGFDPSINYVWLDQQRQLRAGEDGGIVTKIGILKPNKDIRILDVGCGTGGLMRALEDAGYRSVWGIDFSPYAASLARAGLRGSGEVLTGDILSADFGGNKFDVINATEVIEHLRDPLVFFKRARELLAPGGIFVYTTGDIDSVYARVLGASWPYLIPEGHLHYYSPATLSRYFTAVGLVPRTIDSFSEKTALLQCEDEVAFSQLAYIGQSDRGMKGRIFRFAHRALGSRTRRMMTLALGRAAMPLAMHPSS